MNRMKKTVVSTVLGTALGVGVGRIVTKKEEGKKTDKWHKFSDKHLELYKMMNQWVRVKQEGKNLSQYFEKNNYKNIAVYGMSFAGETLIEELKGTGIEVKYGIDKNANGMYSEIDIVTMEDYLENVDAIVVTAITFFDEIEENLSKKVKCPIISLEDILFEV